MFKKIIGWFGLINLGIFFILFKYPKKKQKKQCFDCAIVCGYPANNDGSPSLIMKSRLNKAIELYQKGKVKCLIFSGSNVKNKYQEAQVMEEYALKQGVSSDMIFKENKAKCTYHNLLYAREIMEKKKFKSCLVITNSWHLRKADHYARKFNLDYAMVLASAPKGYGKIKIVWLHLLTNLIMYRNFFKGYY